MKRIKKGVAWLLCVACTLGGCGTTNTNRIPNEKEKEKVYQGKLNAIKPMAYASVEGLKVEKGTYLTIIGRNSGDSFWDEVQRGAEQAVEDLNQELGYTGDDAIRLNYSAPKVRDDVNEQINILDEELARYPLAVGIATIDRKACQTQFDQALENHIPIVTFDSGSDYKDVATACATDNLAASKVVAGKLADAIGGEGEVAVFVQDSNSMTAMQREQGFLEKIKSEYPKVKVVSVYRFDELQEKAKEIAKEQESEESITTQEEMLDWILKQHPELKGIYTTNLDVTQTVVNYLTEAERTDLKVVGFDGGKEQLQYLTEGKVEGLLVQNPFGMGYATVIAMVRAGLEMANEANVNTGYTWVTKENMEEEEIRKMLYE